MGISSGVSRSTSFDNFNQPQNYSIAQINNETVSHQENLTKNEINSEELELNNSTKITNELTKLTPSNLFNTNVATKALGGVSIVEGVFNWGEKMWDGLKLGSNYVVGKAFVLAGKVDESSFNKDMEELKNEIAEDNIKYIFDDFYENTKIGQFIKDNALFSNGVRTGGNFLGDVAITIGTFFAGGELGGIVAGGSEVAEGAELTAEAARAARIGQKIMGGGLSGLKTFGESASNAYKNGASGVDGVKSAGFSAVVNAATSMLGIDINNFNPFKSEIINALTHVGLDGLSTSAETALDTMSTTMYADGYTDKEGNYIKFDKSATFKERYSKLYDAAGGTKNLIFQTLIGMGVSGGSEASGIARALRKSGSKSVYNTNKNVVSFDDYKSLKNASPQTNDNVIDFDSIAKKKISNSTNSGERGKIIEFPKNDSNDVAHAKAVVNGNNYMDVTPKNQQVREIKNQKISDNNVIDMFERKSAQSSNTQGNIQIRNNGSYRNTQFSQINTNNINSKNIELENIKKKHNLTDFDIANLKRHYTDDQIVKIYNNIENYNNSLKNTTNTKNNSIKTNVNNSNVPSNYRYKNTADMLDRIKENEPIRNGKILDQLNTALMAHAESGKLTRRDFYRVINNWNINKDYVVPSQQTIDNYWNKILNPKYKVKYQSNGEVIKSLDQFNKVNVDNGFVHVWSPNHSGTTDSRLYLNMDSESVFKTLPKFMDACDSQGIPYYFKTAGYSGGKIYKESMFTRDESIVLFCKKGDEYKYVNIFKDIMDNDPSIKVGEVPILTTKIDKGIGYGEEPLVKQVDGRNYSFNSLRAEVIVDSYKNMCNKYGYDQIKQIRKNGGKEYNNFLREFYNEIHNVGVKKGISVDNFSLNKR